MSDEQTPSVEEIKGRLSEEIPVEEVAAEPAARPQGAPNFAAELSNLGRQFAETLKTAWNSEERRQMEAEVREGFQSFVSEVDKVMREAKESPVAKKAKEEAAELKTKVESGEVARKARVSIAQGLQWFSEELAKLAQQFTPAEKAPAAEEGEQQ
ncbi:MAG: hypothetical protein AB1791_06070 [Chloroflexota bacterium]